LIKCNPRLDYFGVAQISTPGFGAAEGSLQE
jgi:hypothetical protein